MNESTIYNAVSKRLPSFDVVGVDWPFEEHDKNDKTQYYHTLLPLRISQIAREIQSQPTTFKSSLKQIRRTAYKMYNLTDSYNIVMFLCTPEKHINII